METMIYSISDISVSILSGGDAAKYDCLDSPTEEYNVPVFANAVANKGLYGYTNKPVVNKEAVTIAARGAGVGFIAYRKANFVPIVRLITIIPNETYALAKFLYYYLSTQNIIGGGAAIPQLTVPMVKKIKIQLPPIDYQRRIASMLSAYDNLIENNTRRIRLLEQMAENLYKEWFVRFRFPGHENAEFENGLPKGWKIEKIGNIYDTCSGGTPSRENAEFYNNGSIPWVKTGELQDCLLHNTEECITEVAIDKSSAKILPNHSLLMAMYGVNIGKLGILCKEMACNQAVCAFLPKDEQQTFYYLFFYFRSIRNYLLLISFGAAQQNLSQALIKNIRIMIPSDNILRNFEKVVSFYYDQISIIQRQNELLSRQRDLLLPRLMSGKLEVNI